MCECDIDGGPQAYKEVIRRARKPHTCHECGNVINKGDKYQVCSGIWDDTPASYNWCHDCTTKCDLFCSIEPGFCFTFGSLLRCINECLMEMQE